MRNFRREFGATGDAASRLLLELHYKAGRDKWGDRVWIDMTD
jgi:hypothetical protein